MLIKGDVMDLDTLKEQLENMSDQELFRYLRKSICRSFAHLQEHDDELSAELDIVYSECQRRGKERLYDKIYESISNDPATCGVR